MIMPNVQKCLQKATTARRILFIRKGGDGTDRPVLQTIENGQNITPDTDGEFLYEYRKAVLLALVESGRLTETQFRYAEEELRQQKAAQCMDRLH